MAVTPDDATVRRLASEILARPEYAQYRKDVPEWWKDVFGAIEQWFAWLAKLAVEQPALYYTVLGGMLLLAGLLIAHIGWTVLAALRAPELTQAAKGNARTAGRDLLAEAETFAQNGAYRQAAHAMLLATLAYSARQRVLELHPEDSNRIVRAKLRRSSLPKPLQQTLIELIGRTEAVWFGGRASDQTLYVAWLDVYAQLRGSA